MLLFEDYIINKMKKTNKIIPIFVPHMGCTNECIFCNQRRISGQYGEFSLERVRETIETHLSTIQNAREIIDNGLKVEIAFYGGSFTGISVDLQRKLLFLANEYIVNGVVHHIRLSTRPDLINESMLEYLKRFNVSTIELGVQSLDNKVLALSNRGHDGESSVKACRLVRDYGFELGVQLMTGLPGDSHQITLQTAREVVFLKPDIVRIYPALVIKDTVMHDYYRQGKYKPQTLQEAVETCADMVELFELNNIKVIRIGLLGSDSVSESESIVAGPFHPAFGQLVRSRNFYRKICTKIDLLLTGLEDESLDSLESIDRLEGLENIERIESLERLVSLKSEESMSCLNKYNLYVYSNTRELNYIRGNKNSNINSLKQKYSFKSIIIKSLNSIEGFLVVLRKATDSKSQLK